jgi:hypothetical protein
MLDNMLDKETNHYTVEYMKDTNSQTLHSFDQIRQGILIWIAEVIYKRKKCLSTLDKCINLFDRVVVPEDLSTISTDRIALTQDNCQLLILVCYDLVARFGEVWYTNISELLCWLNEGQHQNKIS